MNFLKRKRLLADVHRDLFSPAKLATRSESTKRHYRLALDNLDSFLGRPARIADLTDQNVVGMMAWLYRNRPLTAHGQQSPRLPLGLLAVVRSKATPHAVARCGPA